MISLSCRGAMVPPNSCLVSAATPAAVGAAAEVPKNRHWPCTVVGQVPEPNPPAPLTDTPSEAAQVGPGAVRRTPPGTPWQGPTAPPRHWVVVTICTGPAAL